MGIRKILGFRTQMEKIREYRELVRELESIDKETALLADNFALQKSQVDVLNDNTDPEICAEVISRFNSFSTQQMKDVTKLCNRKARIEKSLQNIEKDEDITDSIQELKILRETRQNWKKGHINKSIYFNLLKAKMGKTHFADVLLWRGDKLLILQRANDGMFSDEWCIPGGHIDPGEEPIEAASRELFEETGIKLDIDCLAEVGVYENKDVKIHYFMGHIDTYAPANVLLDSSEEIGSAWIAPITELKDYKFIFDMKENIEKILGLQKPNPVPIVLKAFADGMISEEVLNNFALGHKADIEKANKNYFSHKERKDLAKKGEAMPNGKYPIRNSADLHDAIKLVGSSSMPEGEVKAWIIKRAKALKLTDELPEGWSKEEKDDEVKKAESTEDTNSLSPESLDGEKKDTTKKETNKEDDDKSGLEKSLPIGFGVYVNFDDLEEATIFKSLVEDWKASGKLSHVSDVIEKGFDDDLNKGISFTQEVYRPSVELVPEAENKESYGEFHMMYNDRSGDHGNKFSDFLGTLQKVTGRGMPFSILLKTEKNGEQEWKWGKKDHFSINGLRKEESIRKSIEGDPFEKALSEKKIFNLYLNFIEGAKTRLKNIHWGEEDNSKHVYLDSLSDEVAEFEDKIAEAGQSGFGRFKDGEIQGDEVKEDDPVKICQMIFDRTIKFRKELEGKDDFNGEISWIDDFLASLKQSKYRLQMH